MLPAGGAGAATGTQHAVTLSGMQATPVAGGAYAVDNDEWGSGAQESIRTDGTPGFTVASSAIGNATNGAPGAYPSVYAGCHWGNCTRGGLAARPVEVSALTRPGTVTTSWNTSQPGGGAAYDVAYDIWFNRAPAATGQPDGAELMVWLNHHGPVQPFGSPVGTASLGGVSYRVWEGAQPWGDTISYVRTSPATSVRDLDVGVLAADAASRGYIKKSWYLIDVEAGFELWQGGAGLATKSFSVDLSRSLSARPSTGGQIPRAAPSPATASGLSPQAVSPDPTTPGTATNATVDFANLSPAMASGVTVTIRVLNSRGTVVGSQSWTGQNVAPQQKLSETYTWRAASRAGSYTVEGIVRGSSSGTPQRARVATITVK
jgi:cellulose 1,4-beta-cellobiosidase